jgi:Relaxase/Mobilisation nuclease domain
VIIKSLGRKASAKMTGGGKGRDPFLNLVRYMTRDADGERSESVLWHGFYGHGEMSEPEIVSIFRENASRLRERRNGNVLYHEILSFAAGYRLRGEALSRAVADIGQEYLRQRAPNQLAFGAIHHDTDHIHLHLLISANEVGKRDRVRLSKSEFADIQKAVEAFMLEHYGELEQTKIYGRDRSRERLKTQAHEQAMKSRTGAPSRKEAIKARLHGLFEQAQSLDELDRMMLAEGFRLYRRGKSIGVMVRDSAGQERRHRLSTLGLEMHFLATEERLARAKESAMGEKSRGPGEGKGGVVWGVMEDTTPVIAAEELLTGKLHEAWHGPQKDEGDNAPPYTDDILAKIRDRDRAKPKKRERDDDDRER